MNILFIHPYIPGQFEYLINDLAGDPSMRVAVLCRKLHGQVPENVLVRMYTPNLDNTTALEECAREAGAVALAMKQMEQEDGYVPDVVYGHSGWGSLMYVKAFYPSARLIGYFEWYHCMMPEFKGAWFTNRTDDERRLYIAQMNAAFLYQLESCDVRISPTKWQRDVFPERYRGDIRVIHEGVDTEYYAPGRKCSDEIITYVTRGMEPTRCFPAFMDAIRIVLEKRPKCHVLIAGDEKTHYGSKPQDGKTWKQMEVEKGGYDPERVHFLGWIKRESFRTMLQASTVHVYLTLPYVLSWSVLQSMSAGCCLVSSATAPVQEVVEDGVNGLLADVNSPEEIAGKIIRALEDSELRACLGAAARQTVIDRYNLPDCLKIQKELITGPA